MAQCLINGGTGGAERNLDVSRRAPGWMGIDEGDDEKGEQTHGW